MLHLCSCRAADANNNEVNLTLHREVDGIPGHSTTDAPFAPKKPLTEISDAAMCAFASFPGGSPHNFNFALSIARVLGVGKTDDVHPGLNIVPATSVGRPTPFVETG